MLHPGGVDDLPEIAFLIEQPDADYGNAEIARRLEEVAGENAEPSGVEGQPLAEAELHAEITHTRKSSGAMRGGKPARRVEIGSPRARQPLEFGDEQSIGGKRPQPLRRDVLQDDPRVSGAAPRLRVDPLPQRIRLMAPGPAQIERELTECLKPGREIVGRQCRHCCYSILWSHRT